MTTATGCDPYVDYAPAYWAQGYAEGELECAFPDIPAIQKGFGGWNYTEEELRAFAEGDRRRRIVAQIRDLERQLDLERAWAAQMEPPAPPPAPMPPTGPPATSRRPVRNMVSPRNIEAKLARQIDSLEEDEVTSLLLLGA